MIAYLHGKVILRDMEKSLVILETHGVGYEVYMPMPNFEKNSAYVSEGSDLNLFIYTYVREDRITLYGFNTKLQREIFSLLLDVKDVGPKLAVTILSSIDSTNLINILTAQDISALCGIKGIGQSKAERIIMELKNKIIKKAAAFNDIKADDVWYSFAQLEEDAPASVKEAKAAGLKRAVHGGGEDGGNESNESRKNAGRMDFTGGKEGAAGKTGAPANGKWASDMIIESALALETLGYTKLDSFNISSKVFGIVKSSGNIPSNTEELTKECLRHIYSQKNN